MSQHEAISQCVQYHLSKPPTAHLMHQSKWNILTSPLGGRGIFATSDLDVGQVVFVDAPLVLGPRAVAVNQAGCTVCNNIVPVLQICSRCALYLCSDNCLHTESHKSDCELLFNRWKLKVASCDVDSVALFKALVPVRCLLLENRDKELLCNLAAHCSPRHGFEVRNLEPYFEIPHDDIELMLLACRVLDANAFQIANAEGDNTFSSRGLYPVSALMNHQCVPNTRHSFDIQNRMTVVTTKPILAGSEIFTSYSGMLWGSPVRRNYLMKTKHFQCCCERCEDPTEFGTNLAALKCFSRECSGYLLPAYPLDLYSVWTCSECDITVPPGHIGAIQSALGSLLGTLNFDDPEQIQNFMESRLPRLIPKSNQVFLDLKCRLIWIFGESKECRWNELSVGRMTQLELLCRDVLSVLTQLRAGDTHLRGRLFYHLHAALKERARRDSTLHTKLESEIISSIRKAHDILQGDVSAPADIQRRLALVSSGEILYTGGV